MSFPFGSGLASLQQRMLVAASSGSLLGLSSVGALGCSATESRGDAAMNGGAGSMSMAGTGGSAGTAGQSAGTGGSAGMMSMAGTGGSSGNGPGTQCDTGFMREEACYTRTEMESKARVGCGMIAIDPVPSSQQIEAAFLASGCLPKDMACDGCCNPAEAEGVLQADGSCCYVYCPGACCGRAFTVDGEGRLAAVATRSDWLSSARSASVPPLPPALARRIADEWLTDARMEHASIASFARFSLELLGLGAPSSLVEQAQRAALDEVDHARACFSIASRFAGQALGPAALRVDDALPARGLAEAAGRAFLEGCVGETIAAAHARAALEHARDPEVRWALSKIAEDETRHAELAWRFVAWALAQDEPGVAAALRLSLARAAGSQTPGSQASPQPEREAGATLDALHAAGRLSEAERHELTACALAEVVLPCARALLDRAQEPSQDSPLQAGAAQLALS